MIPIHKIKNDFKGESVILVVNLIYCDLPHANAVSEECEDVDTHKHLHTQKGSIINVGVTPLRCHFQHYFFAKK